MLLDESFKELRRVVYGVLIVTAAAGMIGRILAVKSQLGKTPLLGANDRSRWGTVRALVDEGTYSLDGVLVTKAGKRDREWSTIDLVRHQGWDGREHFYSSKPPFLATLLAGKYWLINRLTGTTLQQQPFYVVRLLLITTNVLPLILYFALLAQLVERIEAGHWARVFVMGVATWGTFLTTFAVVVNNHLPAAVSVLVALWASFPIFRQERARYGHYALAGAASAFAFANELPALMFLVLLGAGLFWQSATKTLSAFLPAAALVCACGFLTNYLAHGSWRPPYMHRSDGPLLTRVQPSHIASLQTGRPSAELLASLTAAGIRVTEQAQVLPSSQPGRWVLTDPDSSHRYALVSTDGELQVRAWDNWYEYEGSYWAPDKLQGVDRGEPLRRTYAWHVLLGHHGVFSLTPVWLLSLLGMAIWLRRADMRLRALAAFVLLLTVVCLGFYLARPMADRNYGGVSCGFRWAFWLTPLWLLCLLPAADALSQKRAGRFAGWAMLFVSAVSASYAGLNPWTHPWLFDYWTYVGWIKY